MQENTIQEPMVETKMEKFGKLLIKITIAVFIIPSLLGFIIRHLELGSDSVIVQLFMQGGGMNSWAIALMASTLFTIIFLIVGAITYKNGGSRLIKFAGHFFLVTTLVGAGTCFVNIGGI